MKPKGPFNLLYQNQFFNGWPTLSSDQHTIVMAFPVEGWTGSAAVTLSQNEKGDISLKSFGSGDATKATEQALAALSLDEDGSGWEAVGDTDEIIRSLQEKYRYMRPTLFHSPYEAAAAFMIGHRISIPQARKIRTALAEEFGEKIEVEGSTFHAFPTPQKLLEIDSFQSLNQTKIIRLHAIAQAAIEGLLDRNYLRGLDDEAALAQLETLPGIGPFFSQGILYRGAGRKDSFSQDDMTFHAIKTAYGLNDDATKDEILAITEKWRPYRMWAVVLLHVWLRETNNFPKRTFSKR
jgi:DNA-3-methyladenine glycosylase II